MRQLSRRESRLIALLILIATIALVYFVLAVPVISSFSASAEKRKELALHYAANKRIIDSIPRLRVTAQEHNRMASDYILTAADAGNAGEILRQRLQTAVLAIGGEFRGAEDIAAPPHAAATRFTARMSWPQLLSLLASLQNSRPFLTLSSLTVSANDALVTGRATTLDVQLEASIPFHPAAAH